MDININIGYNIDFLFYQLENFKKFIMVDYIIIINTNKELYSEIKERTENIENIIINPVCIEKKRFHGSILEGIYENIQFCFKNNIIFKDFIILSNKNIFYRELHPSDLDKLSALKENKNRINLKFTETGNQWWWPVFHKTLLSNYIRENNLLFSASAHEGLGFTYETLKSIYNFLYRNNEIRNDLFKKNACVEEFALQTICSGLGYDFFYIGNGTTYTKNLKKDKFVYKLNHNEVKS